MEKVKCIAVQGSQNQHEYINDYWVMRMTVIEETAQVVAGTTQYQQKHSGWFNKVYFNVIRKQKEFIGSLRLNDIDRWEKHELQSTTENRRNIR